MTGGKERKVLEVYGSPLTIGYETLNKLQEAFEDGWRAPKSGEQQIVNRPVFTIRNSRIVLFRDNPVVGEEIFEDDAVAETEVVGQEDVQKEQPSVDEGSTVKEIRDYAEAKGISIPNDIIKKADILKFVLAQG